FMLGLATLIAFALRRAAAASRHLVWSLAIVGLLALPLLSLALPAWQWSVLPDGLLAPASPAASQATRLIEKPAARADVVSPAMRRGAGEASVALAASPRPRSHTAKDSMAAVQAPAPATSANFFKESNLA